MAVSLVDRWERAFASAGGPHPTTRLVLFTLKKFMDRNGGNCWPSTRRIAADSGLTERTVCTHLELAERTGWITKAIKSHNGSGWKLHQYQACIPQNRTEPVSAPRTEGVSAPRTENSAATVLNVTTDRTESHDAIVLKDVQSTSSITSSRNSPKRERAPSRIRVSHNEKHSLPDTWTPTDAHAQLAASRGLDVELEALKLRDWALAEGKKQNDWDARFSKWLRDSEPRKAGVKPNGVALNGTAKPSKYAAAEAADRHRFSWEDGDVVAWVCNNEAAAEALREQITQEVGTMKNESGLPVGDVLVNATFNTRVRELLELARASESSV